MAFTEPSALTLSLALTHQEAEPEERKLAHLLLSYSRMSLERWFHFILIAVPIDKIMSILQTGTLSPEELGPLPKITQPVRARAQI